jgi:hypothetical protein
MSWFEAQRGPFISPPGFPSWGGRPSFSACEIEIEDSADQRNEGSKGRSIERYRGTWFRIKTVELLAISSRLWTSLKAIRHSQDRAGSPNADGLGQY